MSRSIQWQDLGFNPTTRQFSDRIFWLPPGGQEDLITLRAEAGACRISDIEFVLTSEAGGDQVRWWKGLRLVAPKDIQLGVSETQDDQHTGAVMVIPATELGDKKLQIWKAKFLGIHTGMYELDLAPLATFNGFRFTFHWFKDNGAGANAR
jgi:hypothetical protein